MVDMISRGAMPVPPGFQTHMFEPRWVYSHPVEVTVINGLDEVPAVEWNALAGTDNPFVEHSFLLALETSGSVGEGTGWTPCHVLVRDTGILVGAMPLYVKTHSYGEYIFDWAWANAAQRYGIEYYPKLVCAVPFTPATGPRLLLRGGAPEQGVVGGLLSGVHAVAEQVGASSFHVLFCSEEERGLLAKAGLLPRLTYQYHWENRGWSTFESYLGTFRSTPRRLVRKERREAAANGLEVRTLRGHELTGAQLDHLYAFYRDTTGRKGAIPYLTQPFFRALNTSLRDSALVALAQDGARPVAGALSFQRGDHLYGRYWGCLQDFDKLHFELCYYRHIELCIEHGWTRFEAGAQGQHKIKRGLMPSPTYSAHWIRDPGLAEAVADYLPREAQQTRWEMEALAKRGPFRRG